MSSVWDLALASGWRTVLGVRVEGIPHAFIERQSLRVDEDATPGTPSGYDSTVECLMIGPSMQMSIEADRQAGVATGARWDVVLDWDGLGELAAALFGAPTRRMMLLGAVPSATEMTITHRAGDEAGWPASGRAYLGLELLEYSSLDSLRVNASARGICGRPHYHTTFTAHAGYAYLTDRPQAWSGREVTVYEHLISPGGHVAAGTWCQVGDWCHELWVGQIDGLPVPEADGWHLGCIPLVRRLALDLGVIAKGARTNQDERDPTRRRLMVSASDTISIAVEDDDGTTVSTTIVSGPAELPAAEYMYLDTWAEYLAETINGTALVGGNVIFTVTVSHTPAGVVFQLWVSQGGFGAAPVVAISITSSSSWLEPGTYALMRTSVGGFWRVEIPWRMRPDTVTIEVHLDEDTDAEDVSWIPTAGTVLLEQGDRKELATYTDGTRQNDVAYLMTITHRDLGGSGVRVDIWGPDEVLVTVLAGATGTLKDVMLTLATSSGLGINGAYDTLALGQGCGIPLDRIEDDTLDVWPHDAVTIPAVSDTQASIQTLLGGWVALYGRCFVQRRGADGRVRIALVSTAPAATDQELTSADVLMDGHEPAKPLQPANEIVISRGVLGAERQETFRDRARVAVEGAQRWEFSVPGISIADAADAADDFLRASEGVQALTVTLPIGRLQAGDARDLRTQHPLVWSYAEATRAPVSILGRALTWQRDLGRDQEHALLLLEGLQPPPGFLCPSPVIVTAVGSTVTLEAGAGEWFRAVDYVEIYIPGQDAAAVVRRVTAIAGDVVTISSALPGASGAYNGQGRMTYPSTSDATTRQRLFTYVDGNSEWR